jgi:hypothetical protein
VSSLIQNNAQAKLLVESEHQAGKSELNGSKSPRANLIERPMSRWASAAWSFWSLVGGA